MKIPGLNSPCTVPQGYWRAFSILFPIFSSSVLPITANGKWAWNTFNDTQVSPSQLCLICQHIGISTATEQDSHDAHANRGESSHRPLAQDKGGEGRVLFGNLVSATTLYPLPGWSSQPQGPRWDEPVQDWHQNDSSNNVLRGSDCGAVPGIVVAEESICTSTEATEEVLEPSWFDPPNHSLSSHWSTRQVALPDHEIEVFTPE